MNQFTTTANYNSRKKTPVQMVRTAKKRAGSPVSDTASEKAVKDAMMKTTQKIYFPKAFHLPGTKKGQKKEQTAANVTIPVMPERERRLSQVLSPNK